MALPLVFVLMAFRNHRYVIDTGVLNERLLLRQFIEINIQYFPLTINSIRNEKPAHINEYRLSGKYENKKMRRLVHNDLAGGKALIKLEFQDILTGNEFIDR